MLVRELIEELQRVPEDAVPVIGGQVVDGVALRRGTVTGNSAPHFQKDANGETHGLVFLVKTEMAKPGLVKNKAR